MGIEADEETDDAQLFTSGSGVEGYLGGVEDGVRNKGAHVILWRNASIWRRERALWRVSSGRIGGTPPKPSIATKENYCIFTSYFTIEN